MESLADREREPLLPQLQMPEPAERDKEGLPVFTWESFYRTRPGDYDLVLKLAAEGNTIRSIARVIGASKNTVQAILARERSSMTIEQYRAEASLRLRNSLAQSLDRINEAMEDDERMAKASLRDLAYALKELAEKMQLFSGGATHRGGRSDTEGHVDDMDYLRRIQQVEAMEVPAVERAPESGDEGEREEEGVGP